MSIPKNRPIKFDGRSNTVHGQVRGEAYTKVDGTEKVAKVMRKGKDPGAGQFRIGDKNHARTIR